MFRPALVLLAVAALPAPLLAQLNAEQRAQAEARAAQDQNARTNNDMLDRPYFGKVPDYHGPAGRTDRQEASRRQAAFRDRVGLPMTGEPSHWLAIGMREGTPRTLSAADGAILLGRAGIPLRLTLFSSLETDRIMVKASIAPEGSAPEWSYASVVVADRGGRYRIDVPEFAPGQYDLLVEVYDPAHPETPYSASRTTVLVRTP